MEKFIIANSVATRYADIGSSDKAVVLLHGYMESIEIWESFADKLSKNYRVLMLDIPGHGVSEVAAPVHTMDFLADVIYDLLCKVGITRCVLVGHSMGGYIADAVAAKYPTIVEKIIYFHSLPGADTQERKDNRQREIEIISSGRKELLSKTSPGKSFANSNKRRFTNLIEDMALQVMLTEDEGAVALLMGMMQREDLTDKLKQLNIPRLYIFGEQDEILPSLVAREVMSGMYKCEVLWLENSGHMGFIEQEQDSLDAVVNFIEN